MYLSGKIAVHFIDPILFSLKCDAVLVLWRAYFDQTNSIVARLGSSPSFILSFMAKNHAGIDMSQSARCINFQVERSGYIFIIGQETKKIFNPSSGSTRRVRRGVLSHKLVSIHIHLSFAPDNAQKCVFQLKI
jgi:hypothetical protein